LIVFASKGGAPTNPDWYRDLRGHRHRPHWRREGSALRTTSGAVPALTLRRETGEDVP
jgi:hypothetical protein